MTKQNKTQLNSVSLNEALIAQGVNEIKISSHGYEKSVLIEEIPEQSLLMLFAYGVQRKFNDTINSIKIDEKKEKKDEKFYYTEIDKCILRLKDGWDSSSRTSSASALKAFILKALIKKGVLKKEKADTIKGLDPLKMLCEAYPEDTEEKNQDRLNQYSELFDMVNNTDID